MESRVLLAADGVVPDAASAPDGGTSSTTALDVARSTSVSASESDVAGERDSGSVSGASVSLTQPGELPPLAETKTLAAAPGVRQIGLHAVGNIPELVNPAEATPVLLPPGRVRLDLEANGAGRAALWKFVLPEVAGRDPAGDVAFALEGSLPLPTDGAIAWYDEAGNLLGVADTQGAAMVWSEESGVLGLQRGRPHLVGVFVNRAILGQSARLRVDLVGETAGAPVVMDQRLGGVQASFLGLDSVFQSPSDIRWHPLDLLNVGEQATVTASPGVTGREISMTVYRRIPSLQLLGESSGSDQPVFTRVAEASSNGASGATVNLKAPAGSTLGEQEYWVAVAPKGYATGAAGYRIEVRAIGSLVAPATLSAAESGSGRFFELQPTLVRGQAEAMFEAQSATSDKPAFYSFRASAGGPASIRVEAAFDAIVALYGANRNLLAVATDSARGAVTLNADLAAGAQYYVRVANGPATPPLERSGFKVGLKVATAIRDLSLRAPNPGDVAVEVSGSTIGAANLSAPSFFELRPPPGIDFVTFRVSAPNNGSIRISVVSVDGSVERRFGVGQVATLSVPIRTQGAPLQIAVASTASFGALMGYSGLALPRELAIGSMGGQRLSPESGEASLVTSGFDRAGDRAGFEFYQGVVPGGRNAVWTAEGTGGAMPVLVRYETVGSVLRLVDWIAADAEAKARMAFTVEGDRLYAIAAYQVSFQNGGGLKLAVDHPTPIPVGVGMVPDLAYEAANQSPARFRSILQIRGVTLERPYEEDYWTTLLPDRFFAGSFSEDPAMPYLEITPDASGSALRLVVTLENGEGQPLVRWNGDRLLPFRSDSSGKVTVDFSALGIFRQTLEGKGMRFVVRAEDGALGDGTYTLRMTVRTPNPHPYEITEYRWDYPGAGAIPSKILDQGVASFPAGTSVIDIPQNPSGEGAIEGAFASSSVGVRLYRFWTPGGGPFRVWTQGTGADPANTTIRIYRARYAVTRDAERSSWWETIDYLEGLREVEGNTDWYPADRSTIDAQILIEDPAFPAYKQPRDVLGQSIVGTPPDSQLGLPYLPADRQFTATQQDVYFVVVKNEQGSTGSYRLNVSTDDLPRYQSDPVILPQRPTAQALRSVLTLDVPDVERYGQRIGVFEVQMPEWHSGYLGVGAVEGGDWEFTVYGQGGQRMNFGVEVDGERRYIVPPGGQAVTVKVLESGRNTTAQARIRFATTLLEDAALPTNFSALGLGAIAQTLLPTNPWGELEAGEFTGSAPVGSAGRLFRFRAPPGPVEITVAPIAGSQVSFLWGVYEDGRLQAWDRAIPGQPATYRTTIAIPSTGTGDHSGTGRNLVLVVRHASGSAQPAQFGIEIDPQVALGEFAASLPWRTSVPKPVLAFEHDDGLGRTGTSWAIDGRENHVSWEPDQWVRFVVPDGPGQAMLIEDLPDNENLYPLRYDVFDASGKTRITSGTKAFAGPAGVIELPQLESGKAYVLRLAPRDQPLGENLPIHLQFRMAKAARVNGEFVYNVPLLSSRQPPDVFETVHSNYRGDFSVAANLAGQTTRWWQFRVGNAGPAKLEARVEGSSGVRVAIYRETSGGEFPSIALVDYVNEATGTAVPGGKTFDLTTFLTPGGYFLEFERANSGGGRVEIGFEGPEPDLERLVADPNTGFVLRAQMGRASPTQFFDVIAPAGSMGKATFNAYDIDWLDDRPETRLQGNPPEQTRIELTIHARMQVWAVPDSDGNELAWVLAKTLGREPEVGRNDPIKATLVTPGEAKPFQRFVIAIQYEGRAPGYDSTVSGRSKTVGVQAVFEVPTSGDPDLEVETIQLRPNSGQTLVQVSVRNRGYGVANSSESRFTYPTLDDQQPVTAILGESVLAPLTSRVRYLDWIDPVSPDDVTRYQVDVQDELAEIDETNNLGQVAMKSVNAFRPVFSVSLSNGLDGNPDSGVWGRYLDSRGQPGAAVRTDIVLEAADEDDASNTYDAAQEIYLIRSDSPLSYTSGNHYLQEQRVLERITLSALAPTGPNTPNQFVAYAVDRFGLRSDRVIRVIQVVPFPKWMEAGESEVVFNPDNRKYELQFSARPVDYAATLSQMLDANIPLVGNRQNQFYVEAFAERSFSLDPTEAIAPVLPSVSARATILGQDVLNKVFGPGTVQDHVSVLGRIDVRPDTLEAGAFELTTRFDGYPVDHWEGPEIPIFGFDAGIVAAAVQAQVLIDLEFDAAITFAFDLTQADAPLRITSPSFVGLDLRVTLRFEGEVEVAGFLDIASVGGGFFFTLKPRYGLEDMPGSIPLEDFLDEACLGLSATIGGELTADIFGFEVFSLELESDEIQLTDCDVATSSAPGATALTGMTGSGARGMGVGLQGATPALPNDKHVRYTQRILPGDALLPTPSVRPNPQLVVDAATGQRMMAYLDSPSPGAAPALYVARGDASGFGAPVRLDASGWVSRPLLALTRDGAGFRAVLVYQTTPLPTGTTTRNQFLAGQDLRYRYFDGTAWGEELVLTDNALMDWQAAMAFNTNGDGTIAWVQKVAAAPLDARGWMIANDRLNAAQWDKANHRWLPATRLVASGSHDQPAVAVGANGVVAVAWAQRIGQNARIGLALRSAAGTWSISAVANSGLQENGRHRKIAIGVESDGRFTVLTAYTEPGQTLETRVLARTGTLDDLRGAAQAFDVVAKTGGVSSLQLVRAPDGTWVAGWHERAGEFSDAVVVRRQTSGDWSRPARATLSSGDERAFQFAIDGNGAVLSVFERGTHFFRTTDGGLIAADGPDLKPPTLASNLLGTALAVRGTEVNVMGPLRFGGLPGDQRPEALAGRPIDAEVVLSNTGDATADALVSFYRLGVIGFGGTEREKIGERKIRLLPGGQIAVAVPVLVESGLNRFEARIEVAGGREVIDTRPGVVTGQITGRIDLAVESLEIAEEFAGKPATTGVPIAARYEIVNRSGVTYRGPARLTTFWEDPTKPGVRTTVNTGTVQLVLAPGERQPGPALFQFETAGLRLVGVELSEPNTSELSVTNNVSRAPLDLRPDLALRDVTEVIRGGIAIVVPAMSVRVQNFSGVANAELSVVVSNPGSAPVRGLTLRVEHSVEGGAFVDLFTESTSTGLLPGEHREAKFKVPALAGLNLYRARVVLSPDSLPSGLPEPVTSNNIAMTSVVVQGLPDLQVVSLGFNASGATPTLRVGARIFADVRVDNSGIAPAKGVVVELFAVQRGEVGLGVLVGSTTISTVPALSTATVRIDLNSQLLPETTNRIRVVVDRHQNILERSDLNNEFTGLVVVAPPTFTVTRGFVNSGIGQMAQVSSLGLVFSRDLVLPRDPAILRLQNVSTGEFVDPTKYTISLDAATRTVTWRFSGLPGGVLPAGEYVARVASGALADRSGNGLGRDFVLRFFVTPGDANGDGTTNEKDYLLLWRELRKAENSRNAALDIDGDGKVTATDLVVVRENFGRRGAGKGGQP